MTMISGYAEMYITITHKTSTSKYRLDIEITANPPDGMAESKKVSGGHLTWQFLCI